MSLFSWIETKIQKYSIWDFGVLKLCVVVFGIIIGAYISTFVKDNLGIFIAIFVVSYAYLIYSFFRK